MEQQIAHLDEAIAGFQMLQHVIAHHSTDARIGRLLEIHEHTLQCLLEHRAALEAERIRRQIATGEDTGRNLSPPPQREFNLTYS